MGKEVKKQRAEVLGQGTFIHDLHTKGGFSIKAARQAVSIMEETAINGLLAGKTVRYKAGSLHVRDRQSRTGRNPRTGESLIIAPTRTVLFKLSKGLKAELQQQLEQETAKKTNKKSTKKPQKKRAAPKKPKK